MKTRNIAAVLVLIVTGILLGFYTFHKIEKKNQKQAIIDAVNQSNNVTVSIDIEKSN